MSNVCDYCKKEKPWIKINVYRGECIGSTEVHLCSKCYKNTLQPESESLEYNDPESNYGKIFNLSVRL